MPHNHLSYCLVQYFQKWLLPFAVEQPSFEEYVHQSPVNKKKKKKIHSFTCLISMLQSRETEKIKKKYCRSETYSAPSPYMLPEVPKLILPDRLYKKVGCTF